MIVFDLLCSPHGHVFEAWFGSSAGYEEQRKRGLVRCPVCDTDAVDKAVMAPRLSAKGNQRDSAASAPVSTDVEGMKRLMVAMAEAQKKILAQSDHVGDRFADEARAIHLGERPARSIHGRTSVDEARNLIEEGIAAAPLPFPIVDPERQN